jgi:hypothetical protein
MIAVAIRAEGLRVGIAMFSILAQQYLINVNLTNGLLGARRAPKIGLSNSRLITQIGVMQARRRRACITPIYGFGAQNRNEFQNENC